MDPISLSAMALKAVVELTKTLLTKTDEVERLRKRETKFAYQYKKAIRDLAEEAEEVKVRLNVIVQEGNRSAVTSLLNHEDGATALKKLVTLLNTTREFLQAQEVAANRMLDILKDLERKGKHPVHFLADVTGVSTEESDLKVAMDDATSMLESHRADIRQRYDHFNSLFSTFLTATSTSLLSETPPRGPSEAHRGSYLESQSMGELSKAFLDCPFQFSLTNAAAVDISNGIDVSKSELSGSEWFTPTMKQLGTGWVTDNSPISSELSLEKLEELQTSLLEKILTGVEYELAEYGLRGSAEQLDGSVSNNLRCEQLIVMQSTMKKGIERIKSNRFSIAMCGMVKAGKSLFFNALTGFNLLPSDDLPATAWPCRLRHVKGQKEPILSLDPDCFKPCIKELRKKRYGKLMQDYEPPREEDAYAALLDSFQSSCDVQMSDGPTPKNTRENMKKLEIYSKWVDLHHDTKENLLRIEQSTFALPEGAEGSEEVIALLAIVNDIVRVCDRFGIARPENKSEHWPLIRVEFESLCQKSLESDFEFVDLPGVGETGDEFHEFQFLVRKVAKEMHSIVPVLSFKEIPKEDWRLQLPDIILAGLQRSPDLVLCTHLDHVKDRVDNLIKSVVRSFWPNSSGKKARKRVLACATRMGISARSLLKESELGKPAFHKIWKTNSNFYDCALKILGKWESEETYDAMPNDMWRQSVKDQLENSGLPTSIHRLVNETVLESRQRIIKYENDIIGELLHRSIRLQFRLIIEMKRTLQEHARAFAQFLDISEKYKNVLKDWESDRASGWMKSQNELQEVFARTEIESSKKVDAIVEEKIEEFQNLDKLVLSPVATTGGQQMSFQPFDAELFLQEIQQDTIAALASAKRDLVTFVRSIATKSHAAYFSSLREKIRTCMSEEEFRTVLNDDIVAALEKIGSNIEAMFFVDIKKVMRTVDVRHTGATAYRAIEAVIARPFLKQRPADVLSDACDLEFSRDAKSGRAYKSVEHSGYRSVDDLGFMLRAPITVVTSVSWLLGSGIWPFLIQSKKVVMSKAVLVDRLHEELIGKVIGDLQKESEMTLQNMVEMSWSSAASVVQRELVNEEERYNSERMLKSTGRPISDEKLAASLAFLLNLLAAESAMLALRQKLKQIHL